MLSTILFCFVSVSASICLASSSETLPRAVFLGPGEALGDLVKLPSRTSPGGAPGSNWKEHCCPLPLPTAACRITVLRLLEKISSNHQNRSEVLMGQWDHICVQVKPRKQEAAPLPVAWGTRRSAPCHQGAAGSWWIRVGGIRYGSGSYTEGMIPGAQGERGLGFWCAR